MKNQQDQDSWGGQQRRGGTGTRLRPKLLRRIPTAQLHHPSIPVPRRSSGESIGSMRRKLPPDVGVFGTMGNDFK